MRTAQFVLGSVQLGLAYGATNKTGKPVKSAALRLVSRAADAGITQFDTARAYGDSENRLGEALSERKTVRALTKLSPLIHLANDASDQQIRDAVDASIEESKIALRRDRLDCLMLHRAEHMVSHRGKILERLIEHLEDGSILALGVSVQSPSEAIAALLCPEIRHLQLPFNLLDWRWREAGVIDRIAARADVTVHARSVFLQGLLAADDANLWPAIEGVDSGEALRFIGEMVEDFGRLSAADLCLSYARGQNWIDGVVVGLETEEQLNDNLRLFIERPLTPGQCALIETRRPRVPVQLLDPAQWPKRP